MNIEEWTPNLPFDSNKPMWNDEESEGDIDSKNEEDFLDKIVGEEKPGVKSKKVQKLGLVCGPHVKKLTYFMSSTSTALGMG